jgi:hypothetical protein
MWKMNVLNSLLGLNPPSSVRRHSPSIDASAIMAALDGGAPLNLRGE